MPSTDVKCPYCGQPLEPLDVTLGNTVHTVAYKPCTCAGARRERIKEAEENIKTQTENEARNFAIAMRQSGIPPKFYDAEDRAAAHYRSIVEKGKGLYIHGPVGTGKTTLAVAIGKEFLHDGKRVKFSVAPDLAMAMRSFEAEDALATSHIIASPVLILDDLDKINCTPYACERFWNLVNYRYNLLLPTIITANVHLDELADKFNGESGTAIASRIYQTCEDVELTGEDRRMG